MSVGGLSVQISPLRREVSFAVVCEGKLKELTCVNMSVFKDKVVSVEV